MTTLPNAENIQRIECNDCGAWAEGHEINQEDIDLANQIQRCPNCSAGIECLEITEA